jgi:VWFA-related protein
MTISRRALLSALPLCPVVRLLRGQQADPTFSADVKVVNVFATVRDKKGQIVKGLTKDDFHLDDEGEAQTIRYFSAESDLPLTLGLLIDTSGSERNVIGEEREASYRFFDQILREDRDSAFVIHFDQEVELLQDLTSSRQKLQKALNDLEVARPQLQRQGGGAPGGGYPRRGGGSGRRRGGTSLYDAVLLASDELMAHQKGRKALVLLSDGVDNGSKVSLDEGIRSAQRADTLVYTVLIADPNGNSNVGGYGGPRRGRRGGYPGGGYPGGGGFDRPDGKKVLEQLADQTGGRFFEVSHKQTVEKIYAAIEEDLRNEYSLGFVPAHFDSGGAYHRIHLTTAKKDLKVQATQGYYPS